MVESKKPEARILEKCRVFNGFFNMDEYKIEMDRHGGGTQQLTRLVFERGHAVAILAYDPDRRKVVLVSEMRPGILAAGGDPFEAALPAGMIDKGEDAISRRPAAR